MLNRIVFLFLKRKKLMVYSMGKLMFLLYFILSVFPADASENDVIFT